MSFLWWSFGGPRNCTCNCKLIGQVHWISPWELCGAPTIVSRKDSATLTWPVLLDIAVMAGKGGLCFECRSFFPFDTQIVPIQRLSIVPVFQIPRGSHVDAVRRHLATIQRWPSSLWFDATVPMTGFPLEVTPMQDTTQSSKESVLYPSDNGGSGCALIDPDLRDGVWAPADSDAGANNPGPFSVLSTDFYSKGK
jgi:hypothetical protein